MRCFGDIWIIDLCPKRYGVGLWNHPAQYFDSWLDKLGFVEMVNKAYREAEVSGPPDRRLMLRLKAVKETLTERLQKLIPLVVGKEQYAFLAGRYILEGSLVVNEVYFRAKREKIRWASRSYGAIGLGVVFHQLERLFCWTRMSEKYIDGVNGVGWAWNWKHTLAQGVELQQQFQAAHRRIRRTLGGRILFSSSCRRFICCCDLIVLSLRFCFSGDFFLSSMVVWSASLVRLRFSVLALLFCESCSLDLGYLLAVVLNSHLNFPVAATQQFAATFLARLLQRNGQKGLERCGDGGMRHRHLI
ncbi:hypothetical protein QVD17_19204 [Tagetes erecta]|uniref:Uncharacterized protein n=1 Tax=Tagetes erecta TaxID=13708 RepID=A0AAD8KQJ6_TARER|nr:hypothetical protein QVD17_19204 [Tagetes erecta]